MISRSINIITVQPRIKLLFLQGYLEWTVISGENNWKEIIGCENLSRGLASGQSIAIIIGLLVNNGAKYGASMYDLYAYS